MHCINSLVTEYDFLWFTLSLPEVPALVYYSHFTAILVTTLVGLFVLFKLRHDLVVKVLFSLAITFSLLALVDVLLWTITDSRFVMFLWASWLTLFLLTVLLSWYFLYVFIYKKDISAKTKLFAFSALFILEIVSTTRIDLIAFDLTNCNAIENPYVLYIVFASAFLVSLWCGVAIGKRIVGTNDFKMRRPQLMIYFGVLFFNIAFMFATLMASMEFLFVIKEEESFLFEQYGYYAMTAFYALLAYLITTYKIFNIKIFASQALVVSLWVLIGSLLLVVKSDASRVITLLTLALSVVFGLALVRSVRKEVEARHLLAEANEGQERFIHFLSHEVKGYLTIARNGFSAIAQGDVGEVPREVSNVAQSALSRMNDGVVTVENILKSANLKSGNVTFAFAPFDLATALQSCVESVRPMARDRGLSLECTVLEGEYTVVGDRENIAEHVLKNLIENAIHYTPNGSVKVEAEAGVDMLTVRISDTGIGITPEDKKRLFTQGGRGAESTKYNVHSTGHGLFIAMSIVEAHGGTLCAESEGPGKGATFICTIPRRAQSIRQ
jgi:signal transduction histidine kinase